MTNLYWQTLKTDLGPITLGQTRHGLVYLALDEASPEDGLARWAARYLDGAALVPKPLAVAGQILEYLDGQRKAFDLSLDLKGTDFQLKVWRLLLEIPYGETTTYGQVAAEAGCPRGARAVGGAVGQNPVAIIVPCHRVLGQSGQLTGFASGLPLKKRLLSLEGAYFRP